MRHTSLIVSAFLLVGCADLNDMTSRLVNDPREETAERQRRFDEGKSAIEARAARREMSWVEAARRVRELDRSFAGKGTWVFDANDEEYHAYSIAVAQQVDSGKLTFEQYDALRTRKFNEIQRRRRE